MTPPPNTGEGAVVLYRSRDGQLLNKNQLPYEHGKHADERSEYELVTYIPAAFIREEVEWLRAFADQIKKLDVQGPKGGMVDAHQSNRVLWESLDKAADRLSALLPDPEPQKENPDA